LFVVHTMSRRRPRSSKELNQPIEKPQAPSPHEEPLGGIEPNTFNCQICGKAFYTKSQLDRHKETEHEHGTHERAY